MPRATVKHVVGGRPFATKKGIEDYCRRIVQKLADGERLTIHEFAFCCALIDRHPHVIQKAGDGIDTFFVKRVPPYYKNFGLHIRRQDGSVTDVSWKECIAPTSDKQTLQNALRYAVSDQITAFRDKAFAHAPWLTCPITSELLFRKTCHVDHCPPQTFKEISGRWIALQGGPDYVPVVSGDGDTGSHLANLEQLGDWQRYHRREANLRIISETANLTIVPAQVRAA